jgi:hypothetical protein
MSAAKHPKRTREWHAGTARRERSINSFPRSGRQVAFVRASKRVNDGHIVAACDRTKPLRYAWTQRALPDQDGKKV